MIQRLGNENAWCVLSGEATTDLDKCRYRYELGRVWAPSLGLDVYCMLNPSKATHDKNDLTITKCTGFTRHRNRGGFVVINLFALRTPYPRELVEADDPIGPDYRACMLGAIDRALRPGYLTPPTPAIVIAAWGAYPPHKRIAEQKSRVLEMVSDWWCFGLTTTGHPKHPSRLPYSTKLEHFSTTLECA